MKRLIQCLLPIGIATFLLFACEQKPEIVPSGKTVRIGIIAPFTGSDFAKGKEGLRGVEIAMKIQPLLENGDQIELVLKDDQNEPLKSVKALQELVKADHVSAIVTFSGSSAVLAMAAVADTYETPILAALATHPDVTTGNGFISQLCSDDRFQGTVAALFVRDELLIDKVAVFSNLDSRYSRNLAAVFKQKYISIDGRVTDSVSMSENAENLNHIIETVQANNPELLYLPIKAENVIRIIKELEKLNWAPKIMVGDGLLATILTQYSEEVGLLDGILATDFFHYNMQMTPYGEKAFEAAENHGTSYTVLGVEACALLASAMNRCSDPGDRKCINQNIRNTTDFIGVSGRISISSNGKAERPLVVNTIKRGRTKFVVKVY